MAYSSRIATGCGKYYLLTTGKYTSLQHCYSAVLFDFDEQTPTPLLLTGQYLIMEQMETNKKELYDLSVL